MLSNFIKSKSDVLMSLPFVFIFAIIGLIVLKPILPNIFLLIWIYAALVVTWIISFTLNFRLIFKLHQSKLTFSRPVDLIDALLVLNAILLIFSCHFWYKLGKETEPKDELTRPKIVFIKMMPPLYILVVIVTLISLVSLGMLIYYYPKGNSLVVPMTANLIVICAFPLVQIPLSIITIVYHWKGIYVKKVDDVVVKQFTPFYELLIIGVFFPILFIPIFVKIKNYERVNMNTIKATQF